MPYATFASTQSKEKPTPVDLLFQSGPWVSRSRLNLSREWEATLPAHWLKARNSPLASGDDEWDGLLPKANQSRGGRLESTGIEVEPSEHFLEVNVEPLTAGRPADLAGRGDQLGSNAQVPRRRIDHQVLDPSVRLAVPDHVDKTKQLISISRGNPAEAVLRQQRLPIGLIGNDNSNFKRVAVKCGDLKILKLSSPLVSTRHEFMVFGR